jgi:hypothetical protein
MWSVNSGTKPAICQVSLAGHLTSSTGSGVFIRVQAPPPTHRSTEPGAFPAEKLKLQFCMYNIIYKGFFEEEGV